MTKFVVVDATEVIYIDAPTASDAALVSGLVGNVEVFMRHTGERFSVEMTPVVVRRDPTPLPKLTKPDRPSNVEALKPTVELPDLSATDLGEYDF